MRSIGPAVTREQSPAFLRNSNGRLDLPGPTQEAAWIPRRNSKYFSVLLCSLSPNLWVCAFLFLLWSLLWTYSLFLHLADFQALESFSRAKKVSQSFLSLALSQPYSTISEGFVLTMLPFLLFKWFSGHSLSSAMPVGQHHCGPCHGTLGRGWTCSFTYSSCLCGMGITQS